MFGCEFMLNLVAEFNGSLGKWKETDLKLQISFFWIKKYLIDSSWCVFNAVLSV